ncbi:reverse transcriptase domain-containing protein [Tanacetum coccineum]
MESVSFPEPPPLIGTPEKQNLNKFCDYHGDRGHNTNDCYQLKKQIEEDVVSRKLAHLVKDIRRNNQRNGSQGRNNVKVINMIRGGRNRKRPFEGERSGLTDELTFQAIHQNQLTDEPIILEGMIEDHQVRRILVNSGSSSEIMYEHCFRNLSVNIRSRVRRCRAPLIGFSGETYHPLGIIDLRVTMGETERNKTVLMEFAIVKCRSPYNVIIGRTGMRSLRAVGSTIFSIIKFPTNQGIVTMETSREALWECRQLEKVQASWKEVQWHQHKEKMSRIREQAILRTKSNSGYWPNQARNDGNHVDSRLQTIINRRALGKHRGIRMGRVRKNCRTAIRHGESTKDIPSRRTSGPYETTYDTRQKTCIEIKGVPLAEGRDDHKEEGEELASLTEYPYKCFL